METQILLLILSFDYELRNEQERSARRSHRPDTCAVRQCGVFLREDEAIYDN